MLFSPFFDFVNKKPNHKCFIFMQQSNISSSNLKKKMLSSYGIFIKSWFLLFTFFVYRHSPIRREIQFAANVVHSICYRSCIRIDRVQNNCYTNWKIKKKNLEKWYSGRKQIDWIWIDWSLLFLLLLFHSQFYSNTQSNLFIESKAINVLLYRIGKMFAEMFRKHNRLYRV